MCASASAGPRAGGGAPKLDAHIGGDLLTRRLGERAPQIRRRRLGSAERRRVACRLTQHVDEAGLRGRPRNQQVSGHLVGCGAPCLPLTRRPLVRPSAVGGAKILIDRGANQRMREAKASAATVLEQTASHERAERARRVLVGEAG